VITERFQDPGSFTIPLDPNSTPLDLIVERISEFGHVVITPQRFHPPAIISDADLLSAARYSGVVLELERSNRQITIRGQGLVWHLGDSEGAGGIFENLRTFTTATPTTVLTSGSHTAGTGLLPNSIIAGTIVNTDVPAYSATHQFETPLDAIRTYSQTVQGHWRINPNGTFDFCDVDRNDVYVVTSPTVVAIRYGWGSDPIYTGVNVRSAMTRRDATQWASKALMIEQAADGTQTLESSATISHSYTDLHGNALVRSFRYYRPATADANLGAFLTQALAERALIDEMEIDTDQWEIAGGSMRVGDFIWVYDPPSGFVDTANEVQYRGQTIWPAKARVFEGSWPLVDGMGVYYRPNGVASSADWIDLTQYVAWESNGADVFGRMRVGMR
jgi:hypothetical protein